MPCSTGPATADTRAAMPGSTTRRGSASRSVSTESAVGSGISSVKVGLSVLGGLLCVDLGPDRKAGPAELTGPGPASLSGGPVQVIKKSGSRGAHSQYAIV